MTKWIAAALLVTTSCLPIPVRKTFVTWPEGKIRVVDSSGKPVAKARVRVTRVKYPYGRDDESRTITADENGELATKREETTMTVYPLMMHGVPGYSFRACAEAKGYAGGSASWPNNDQSATLEIKLVEGSRPCEVELDPKPPPPNALRVESIERQSDGRFLVVLAMPPDANVTAGEVSKEGADPMKIVEVAWLSSPGAPIRRARVFVTGAALSYAHGDLVTRR